MRRGPPSSPTVRAAMPETVRDLLASACLLQADLRDAALHDAAGLMGDVIDAIRDYEPSEGERDT